MGRSFGESLSYKTHSIDSLETRFPERLDRGENLVEKPMHPSVLAEEKIKVVYQRRESGNNFIKTYIGVIDEEPIDVEIASHLECLGGLTVYIGSASMTIIELMC